MSTNKEKESQSDAERHERMAEHVDETYQTRRVPEEELEITSGTLVPEHQTKGAERQGIAASQPAGLPKPSAEQKRQSEPGPPRADDSEEEIEPPTTRPS